MSTTKIPDEVLLDAEQEFRQIEARIAAMREDGADDDAIDPVFDAWMDLMDLIETTSPITLAGCAAKMRILLHENVGLPSGESEHDMLCLRQVLATIERLASAE